MSANNSYLADNALLSSSSIIYYVTINKYPKQLLWSLGEMVSLSVSFNNGAYVVLFCFHVMLAVGSVTLNGLLVVTILASKSLRSENRFLYILNTCLGNFSLGVFWLYDGLFDSSNNPLALIVVRLLSYNLMGVIFLSILTSQCEQHFAVTSPFRYLIIMTQCRTIGVLVFCWIFPFSMTLIYALIGDSWSLTIKGTSNIITNFAIFIIMCGMNIKLYLIAKSQQERKMPGSQRDSKKSSLKLIVIVSCTFLVVWTPSTVHECVCGFYPCLVFERNSYNPFIILIVVTSVVNPLLYLCGSRAIRSAVLKIYVPCTIGSRTINPMSRTH